MKYFRLLTLAFLIAALILGIFLVGIKSTMQHVFAASSDCSNSSDLSIAVAHRRNGESTQVQNAGLNAIAAISANDIWTVGSSFDSALNEHALIEHWNGSKWSTTPSPSSTTGMDNLVDVKTIHTNDVWAVGSSGISTPTTLIEHWNGSAWKIVAGAKLPPMGGAFFSLAVINSNDVWAVGEGYSAPYNKYPLIEHWNGSQWTIVQAPANISGDIILDSVTAVTSKNVWAVGCANGNTFIEHWNGITWQIIASPNKGVSNFLSSVSAVSASDIWAVGGYASQEYSCGRFIEHWNGSKWSIVQSPEYLGLRANTNADVSASSTNNAWLVGADDSRSYVPQGFTEHWDGIKWSVIPAAHKSSNTQAEDFLEGIVTINGNSAWAVGSTWGTVDYALIEHWNGSQWQIVPSP